LPDTYKTYRNTIEFNLDDCYSCVGFKKENEDCVLGSLEP